MLSRTIRVGCLLWVVACSYNPTGAPNDVNIDAPIDAGEVEIDAALDAMQMCPAGYQPLPLIGGAYRFVSSADDWGAAELDCEDDAAAGERATHLVVIDDVIEQQKVIDGPQGDENLNDQWIGLTDLATEDTFLFVTDQAITFVGVPGGNAANKDCVRLKNTEARETKGCNETNKYVCECDGRAASAARYPNLPDGN